MIALHSNLTITVWLTFHQFPEVRKQLLLQPFSPRNDGLMLLDLHGDSPISIIILHIAEDLHKPP